MKSCLPPVFASLLLISAVSAQEGKKYAKLLDYENVTIRKVEPDGIRIFHSGGIAKIPLEELPAEIAVDLGLNQEDAELHRGNVAVARQEAAVRAQENAYLKDIEGTLSGRVFHVEAGKGLLLHGVRFDDGKKKQIKVPYQVRTGGPTGLYPDRPVTYETRHRLEWVPDALVFDTVRVECDTRRYVDGSRFKAKAYLMGKYSYQDTDRGEHTVARFSTDPDQVLIAAGLRQPPEVPESIPAGRVAGTGTGFFITANGHLLTNHHVVEGHSKIEVRVADRYLPAKVLKYDATNDIALLHVEAASPHWLSLGDHGDVGLAKEVFTVGFPQVTMQGTAAKFTEGSVSSLSGLGDDIRFFQVSVPVQPGNSGGPLVDSSGKVVGIVTARLRDGVGEEGLRINQNVNYALKIGHAKKMLGSAFVPPHPKETPGGREALVKSVADAVALIRAE